MPIKSHTVAAISAAALVMGCATPRPPPSTLQVNVNFSPQDQSGPSKRIARGAISGVPQRVGFYYSVNPDCTSDGLVQLRLKSAPSHGAVDFAQGEGYSNFPQTSPGHECNRQRSPGVEVIYTSAKNFSGEDRFTVQGVGPKGKFMETDYTVNVLAP